MTTIRSSLAQARKTCARRYQWVKVSTLAIAGISLPAAAQDAPADSSGGMMNPLFFMIILFGVMWLFLIRPNQKREKARSLMLAGLGKGDKVVTNGGVLGTIVGLNEKTVVLRVSDEPVTKLEFLRSAVTQVSEREGEKDSTDED